jgi:hypothetical protein
VVDHLRGAGIAVLVLQPLQVKAYARLHLRRAKNDQLDVVLIAACAAVLEAAPIAPDPRLSGLRDALSESAISWSRQFSAPDPQMASRRSRMSASGVGWANCT